MKTLHLLRHAKSSWDHPGLPDKERPLNERGVRACALVGPAILKSGYDFAAVYCSAGRRARETIELISEAVTETSITWAVEEALYTFSAGDLLEWCHEIDDSLDEVMIVGHNPALTELCTRLSGRYADHIPTCAYVKIENPVDSWRELGDSKGTITEFITPKAI